MSIAPRTPKEFAQLLQTDPEVRRKMHDLVTDADKMIVRGVREIMLEFMRNNDVDPRLMKGTLAEGLKLYYKQINLLGDFVKMY